MLLPRRLRTSASAVIALTAIALGLAPAVLATPVPPVGSSVSPVEYRLPFTAGQSYQISQGWHGSYSHSGTSAYAYDFRLPAGTPVVAAAAGVVAFVEDGHRGCGGASFRSASNSVTIYHADGTATLYGHLSAVSVQVGQVVTGGQEIALSGRTGFTGCEAHLHFAREAQGRAVTQSMPVYFGETGRQRIPTGSTVTSRNPVCAQTTLGLPDDAFCGVYTTATDLGTLEVTRLDTRVRVGSISAPGSHTAGLEGGAIPAAPGPPAPPISATWLGRYTFSESGGYTFTITSDGDVRLWIDGSLVLGGWADTSPTREYSLSLWLPSGQHVIRLEYRSGQGPLLQLDWRLAEPDDTIRTIY